MAGCGDVLSLQDLETAKKHQIFEAEVITGKQGGIAGGADIKTATNAITGQVQTTLPETLRQAGFKPASFTFVTGGGLTASDYDKAVYNPAPNGDNNWYAWGGAMPKTVPAGSTPQTTGGFGATAWSAKTDPFLRADLAAPDGAGLVGSATYADIRAYTGSANRIYCGGRINIFDGAHGTFVRSPSSSAADNDSTVLVDALGRRWLRLTQGESRPEWSGALGDGINNDAPAFQSAINATPWGGVLTISIPKAYWKIDANLRIDKPITIRGNGGSTVTKTQMPCLKFPVGVDGFVLVPTLNGYLFEYGITGVHMSDIMLEGVSGSAPGWARYGITVDETVNGGVYHVRDNSFNNVHIRYFDHAIRMMGTVYLNIFNGVHALFNGVGCRVDRNAAGQGYSDQNKFFGCEFVLNQSGLLLSTTGHAGSQTIHGCTISENTVQGLTVGYNTVLSILGNTIENNPIGLQIVIPATVTNPASEAAKHVAGNWFLSNDVDIKVLKSTTALTGQFAFPLLIDANTFSQTVNEVLKVEAPTGAGEFDSRQFIFSSSNTYAKIGEPSGPVPDSKISAGWAGYNGFHEDGKVTITCSLIGNVKSNVGFFIVPYGKQCYVKYNMLSIPTTSAAGYTQTTCDINFSNVNTSASPVVVHSNIAGRNGEFLIARADVPAGGMRVAVDMKAISSGHTAIANIEYCLI